MKVGFIGLGTMGGAMAANIQKAGLSLVVFDPNPNALAPFLARGATAARNPADVAAEVDVVFTSLPGPQEIEQVVLGDDGVLQGAAKGLVHFDLSTNAPSGVRMLEARAAARGVAFLDAPVSGGPRGAQTGKLAVWVGGDQQVYEANFELLRTFADQLAYVGPAGSATVAKLVHNLSGYAINAVMAECFTLGVKAGLDPVDLWHALRNGAVGRRRTYDALGDQFLKGQFEPAAFALQLAHKDVRLAVELGRELNVPMRQAALTLAEMTEAMNRGWGRRDSRSFMALQTERAGVTIAAAEEAIRQELAKS